MSRRDSILKAAEILLIQHGPNRMTIASVAKQAHVGVGTVYLEFRGKDDIVREISTAKYTYVLRQMRRAMMRGSDFAARWREVMNARLDAFITVCSESGCALELMSSSCGGVQDALLFFEKQQRELLVDFLDTALESEQFRPHAHTTLEVVETLLTLYAPFRPPAMVAFPPQAIHEHHERVHDIILKGLCTS